MAFKVSARTIFLLGAELISSDGVALYELIKNAFDARSPDVTIRVVNRMEYSTYLQHLEYIDNQIKANADKRELRSYRKSIIMDLDPSVLKFDDLKEDIIQASSWSELKSELEKVNYIEIKDTGSGMSAEDLEDIYLTIGTSVRLNERAKLLDLFSREEVEDTEFRPILGEKGVGRLSALRLGNRLYLKTSRRGEKRWNLLDINWRIFAAGGMIEDVDVSPEIGPHKKDSKESGTLIRISALASEWDVGKLEKIARREFSKLTDPFTPKTRYPIRLRFNGDKVIIPPISKILFSYAHAKLKAEFTVKNNTPRLVGRVEYLLREREKAFTYDGTELIGFSGARSQELLKSSGPFSVEFYWYNRLLLHELEGIGDRKEVSKLIEAWAGGLMLFRDGFRVNPYGNPEDDWLGLDKKAFKSGGYKVNRGQIIGKVNISSIHNRSLVDQTNREGLRECEEKSVLVNILKHVLEVDFRAFLNDVDKEEKAKEPLLTFDDLEERVQNEEEQILISMRLLQRKYPKVDKDTRIITAIRASANRIRTLMKEAEQLAKSYEEGRGELLNLSGLGLMVEIIAHELNRATVHTLTMLAEGEKSALSNDTRNLFEALEAQLKTIQKRLRILDPLSTAGRQSKEWFDLIEWTKEILSEHEAQFKRHGIKHTVRIHPKDASKTLRVRMVKGMFIQIIENLLSNSIYWQKQQKVIDNSFTPEIRVTIDTENKILYFADNGPGIAPKRKEEVFHPFFTTKPPGEGKGLGLFISREIAKYHNVELYLSDRPTFHDDRLDTFALNLEGDNDKNK